MSDIIHIYEWLVSLLSWRLDRGTYRRLESVRRLRRLGFVHVNEALADFEYANRLTRGIYRSYYVSPDERVVYGSRRFLEAPSALVTRVR
ncbi:hypothetical protein [Deinococcus pimensis]|uniref:hypothetical protein n=1 Tax=Deinococcus pimensis TaxID=309888 RepID=UPI00047FE9BC|nr:hypothetical protein [Deinococcus pimensis]